MLRYVFVEKILHNIFCKWNKKLNYLIYEKKFYLFWKRYIANVYNFVLIIVDAIKLYML